MDKELNKTMDNILRWASVLLAVRAFINRMFSYPTVLAGTPKEEREESMIKYQYGFFLRARNNMYLDPLKKNWGIHARYHVSAIEVAAYVMLQEVRLELDGTHLNKWDAPDSYFRIENAFTGHGKEQKLKDLILGCEPDSSEDKSYMAQDVDSLLFWSSPLAAMQQLIEEPQKQYNLIRAAMKNLGLSPVVCNWERYGDHIKDLEKMVWSMVVNKTLTQTRDRMNESSISNSQKMVAGIYENCSNLRWLAEKAESHSPGDWNYIQKSYAN